MIEIAICPHLEESIKTGDGTGLVSECPRCHQVLRYKEGEKEHGTIVRLGRIGEAVVLPVPGTPTHLTPTEVRLVSAGYMQNNDKDESHQPLNIKRSAPKRPALVVSTKPQELPVEAVKNEKEQVIMVSQQTRGKYNRDHRDEILADRLSMGHKKAMAKHGISQGEWYGLKRKWKARGFEVPDLKRAKDKKAVPGKKSASSREDKNILHRKYEVPEIRPNEFFITITEADLHKLADEEYTVVWMMIGEVIRNRFVRGG